MLYLVHKRDFRCTTGGTRLSSPEQQVSRSRPEADRKLALAIAAVAFGGLAVGAAAVGALASGALSIKRFRLLKGNIEELEIGRLVIGELGIQSRPNAN